MNQKTKPFPLCPVARGLDSVGDAWSILILRDAHSGLTRFDQFRQNLGIAPTMLTRRLASLTGDGLLEKRLYSERPPREEYVLTRAGRDFLPVLMMIGAWAQRNCGVDLARYIDDTTGLEIEPIGVDGVSGAKLGSRPIRMSLPDSAG
ncbi:helix-turn-helix transcriptional regulator [Methylobacterium sp. BTF04]|uniref:winged helix-turn-helix transcriptional regulator n=1 Tax=Methylobacterium sp. BTF04 TaxID=2708300 RepID=UPI0013D86C1E|nr:helix-turn-helix domain-containing protein [Methylobacterium sp. BTF04]NEU12727.1 helix-turn-helix transcriptional regulator [Methylobacterium sp. BTF04]